CWSSPTATPAGRFQATAQVAATGNPDTGRANWSAAAGLATAVARVAPACVPDARALPPTALARSAPSGASGPASDRGETAPATHRQRHRATLPGPAAPDSNLGYRSTSGNPDRGLSAASRSGKAERDLTRHRQQCSCADPIIDICRSIAKPADKKPVMTDGRVPAGFRVVLASVVSDQFGS